MLFRSDEVKGRSKKLDKGGFWQWRNDVTDVLLQGQSIGAFTQAQHLLGVKNVFRLNPKVPNGLFALDKLSKKELLSKAAHESRKLVPQFKEMFMEHKAPEFKPCHSL